jgi:geranial dehydrogenase
MQSRDKFFIGNEWVSPSSTQTFKVVNASTGEIVATAPEGSNADIDAAVSAARAAFEYGEWANSSPSDRAKIMERFLAAFVKRGEELAQTVSTQNGMPIGLSTAFEAEYSAGLLQYYTEQAKNIDTALDIRPSQMGKETHVKKVPLGVVAAIVPWNYPVTLAMSKIAPAMAAGCTLVIKPSPGTVLDSYILAEAALEAGVPPGVLNWVAADREVGAYLVSHPGVDKVAFTGSSAAGRLIAETCGSLLRPVTLELGGKSAAIVLEDADIDAFIEGVPMTCLLNNGQTCFAGTRILAPKNKYKQISDAVAEMVSSMVIGDALDPETQMGPMASELHRERVESYIVTGKNEAKLIAGGSRPKNTPQGWFVEPTVFTDVSNNAVIAREEIFGPVLSIIPFDGEEEAISLANDSEFGLGGSVWSADSEHALKVANQVNSGTVGVNGYVPSIGAPFGGVKASGIGREIGPEAVDDYQILKSTYIMS